MGMVVSHLAIENDEGGAGKGVGSRIAGGTV
jgi:hypothetical protein